MRAPEPLAGNHRAARAVPTDVPTPSRRAEVRIADALLTMRDAQVSRCAAAPRVEPMFSTMLTKRRAVDHCRVRSSLCRMP